MDEAPPVLTLARGHETSIPAHLQDKKSATREPEQGDIFYKRRNLRQDNSLQSQFVIL